MRASMAAVLAPRIRNDEFQEARGGPRRPCEPRGTPGGLQGLELACRATGRICFVLPKPIHPTTTTHWGREPSGCVSGKKEDVMTRGWGTSLIE